MIKNKKQNKRVKTSPLEEEIFRLVDKALEESQIKLTKGNVQEIVQHIMPDLDRMIANKVQNHFVEIGEFLLKKFKTEE